jgi:MerR family transcriptional regulator, copper efflux regulator
MLISELAAKTGVSTDTIRFYEKEGLLQPDGAARGDNNYRQYTDEAIEKPCWGGRVLFDLER